jgi:hypothetical protein
MSTKNSYPELPEIPFAKTKVDISVVIAFARSLVGKYSKEAIRMAYAIFRFESANGTKGVNNNYGGIQADVGRWKNLPGNPVATCVKSDSGGQLRRFLCFSKEDGFKVSFELICVKATERKMVTVEDYFKHWVGNSNPGKDYKNSFAQVLEKGKTAIP